MRVQKENSEYVRRYIEDHILKEDPMAQSIFDTMLKFQEDDSLSHTVYSSLYNSNNSSQEMREKVAVYTKEAIDPKLEDRSKQNRRVVNF